MRLLLPMLLVSLAVACQEAAPPVSEAPGGPGPAQGETSSASWRSFPKAYRTPSQTAGKADSYDDFRQKYPEWYAITTPAAEGYRPFTEWEDLDGTLITYADYLTTDPKISGTMTDIVFWGAKAAKMFVVYQSNKAKDHLVTGLKARGMTQADIDDRVEMINLPNETIWFVDFGPFPLIDSKGRVAFVDKRYYHERVNDDALSTRLGQHFEVSTYRMPFSYEWGGFQADDIGDCYSSDRIIQIAKAQTGQTQADLEKLYADYAGCKQVVWLKSITDDGTGHLDMFFKLADRNTVVHSVYMEPMVMDSVDLLNKKRMEDNIALLESLVLVDGSKLTIHKLPMPNGAKDPQFGKVPRTFVNSHLVNGYNLWPVYSVNKDLEAMALEVWKQAMPGYEHVGILSDEISLLSGTIHCVTRGIPALTYEKWVPDGTCSGGSCGGAEGGYAGSCEGSEDCFGPEWLCECNACPCEGTTPSGCGEVSFEGQCSGSDISYCEGGAVQSGACAECCGFDPAGNGGSGWYDCLTGDACSACADECSAGEADCSAELTHAWTCTDADGDGCMERVYEWCGDGSLCEAGSCGGDAPGEDVGGGGTDAGAWDAGTGGADTGAPASDVGGSEDVGGGESDSGGSSGGAGPDAVTPAADTGAGGTDDSSGPATDGAGGGSGASTPQAGGASSGGCSSTAPGGAPVALFALLALLAPLALRRRRDPLA